MKVTGLILAGGLGARMGGVDKGLQVLQDKPLVAHAIARLAPQVDTLAINANRHLESYASFGLPVWPDASSYFAGPLAGMQTGLARCATSWLLVAPCDSPFLPSNLATRLRQALDATPALAAYAITGSGNTRQPHPVFCLLHKDLLPTLDTFLAAGGRKTGAWLKSAGALEVPFDDATAFDNINTPEQLRMLQQQH